MIISHSADCRLSAHICQRMKEAASSYVSIEELQKAVGKRLSLCTGFQDARVASGVLTALMAITAAAATNGDIYRLSLLPENANGAWIASFLPNEYDRIFRFAGVGVYHAKEGESIEGASAVVLSGSSTAMPFFHIPAIIIADKDIVPEQILKYKSQADALIISSDTFRGPERTAVILCTEALAGMLDCVLAPRHGIGRSFKIGKEEIVGACYAMTDWMQEAEDGAD